MREVNILAVRMIKTWKKRERGSKIIFPIILRLLEVEYLVGKGEEFQDKNKWGWTRIKNCMELFTPL